MKAGEVRRCAHEQGKVGDNSLPVLGGLKVPDCCFYGAICLPAPVGDVGRRLGAESVATPGVLVVAPTMPFVKS